jgi:hypothetical protein
MTRASSNRERLTLVVLAAAPAVAIQLLRAFDHATLPEAGAAAPASEVGFATPVPSAEPPTSAQARAAEWIRDHAGAAIARDPFQNPLPEPAETPVAPPPRVEPTLPTLKVSGFLGRGPTAMVAINRRICRAGDDLGDGWTLEKIDSDRRVVTLHHDSGVRKTVESN